MRKALIVIRAGKGLSSQEGLDESEIVVQFSVPLIFFCMADFYWMGPEALRFGESQRCGGLSESLGVATPQKSFSPW